MNDRRVDQVWVQSFPPESCLGGQGWLIGMWGEEHGQVWHRTDDNRNGIIDFFEIMESEKHVKVNINLNM
jgi:hypothetical protein